MAASKGASAPLSITSGTTHPLMPDLRDGAIDMIVMSEQTDGIDDARMTPRLMEPLPLAYRDRRSSGRAIRRRASSFPGIRLPQTFLRKRIEGLEGVYYLRIHKVISPTVSRGA